MDDVETNLLGSFSETLTHTPLPDGSSSHREAESHLLAYLNNLPYECESNEIMQEKLHLIVQRMVLCAKCRDWKTLTAWIGTLQWWDRFPLASRSIYIYLVGYHSNTPFPKRWDVILQSYVMSSSQLVSPFLYCHLQCFWSFFADTRSWSQPNKDLGWTSAEINWIQVWVSSQVEP